MNNEVVFINLINIPVIAFMLFMGCNVKRFKSQGIFYGVRVPNKYRDDERIKAITDKNKKEMIVSVISITVIMFIFALITQNITICILEIVAMPIVFSFIYKRGNEEMIKLKEDIKWNKEFKEKIYIDLKVKEDNYSNETINNKPFIIAFILASISLFVTIFMYNKLPSEVPMKFDFNGVVIRTTNIHTALGKFEIFMIPLISIGIVAIFYFITKYDYKKRHLRNLNGGTYEEIKDRDNLTGKALNKFNGRTAILTAILLLGVDCLILGVIPNTKFNIKLSIYLSFGYVIIVLIESFRIMRETEKAKKYKKSEKEYYSDDDKLYKWGMFYYNTEDPSVLKEKRFGIGYDFNYGNIKGQIIMGFCIICLIGSIILTLVKY